MKKTNQKGITLIALIITIIVMLILVGVSVNIALDGGLFKAAQSGAKQTESERQKEEEISAGKMEITIGNKKYSSMESYAAGNAGIPIGLKLGDEVEYTPNPPKTASNTTTAVVNSYTVTRDVSGTGSDQTFKTDTTLKWKVLSMDEVTGITLIADKPATNQKLSLKGMDGLNNAIDILDGICENLYSCVDVGVARSLNLDDFYEYYKFDDSMTVEKDNVAWHPYEIYATTGWYYSSVAIPEGVFNKYPVAHDGAVTINNGLVKGSWTGTLKLPNLLFLDIEVDGWNGFFSTHSNVRILGERLSVSIHLAMSTGKISVGIFSFSNNGVEIDRVYYVDGRDEAWGSGSSYLRPVVHLLPGVELSEDADGTWTIIQ